VIELKTSAKMEAMRAAGRVAAIAPQDIRIDTAVG
jgi:hypothetical protein